MKNECLQAVTTELDAAKVPYRVDQSGRHIHVKFGPNYEHLQVIPKSGSDHRGPLNARADVRRTIRLQGLAELAQREAMR